MKKISIITLIISALVLVLAACYEIESYVPDPDTIYTPGERIEPRAEKEIAVDQTLFLPLGTLVAMNLEHFDSPSSSLLFDTDTNGTDIIPYQVKDTAILVFQPDINPDYILRLYNEYMDSLIFSLHNDTDPVTSRLAPGKYYMKIISQIPYGIDTAGSQMIFIQPDLELAQTKKEGVKYWYMTSRSMECVKCDLGGIDLSGTYIAGADFEFADFTEAILDNADIQKANAQNADFSSASLWGTDLRGINLSFGVLKDCDMSGADFRYSILNAADLSGSVLYGSNFCFATKNGWIVEDVLADTTTQCFP